MIICDTGPLVALANVKDRYYAVANDLFRTLHMSGEEILLPATVMAEVCYWLNAHGGPEVEAAFLDAVAEGTFTLVDLTTADVERMASLVRAYASFPLGGTDASVAAVAERLGVYEIATFDRRHFPALTPAAGGHFSLLPEVLT
ncbi:PIN domain-containing protein [Nocardioides sp. GY 10113]|uniref:type II toxin-antitoxin system VapC family toxin n=1 Tax=Nocardioides sp. GY 10113 TaxID=2569761 RepID=UPI0010A86A72|nr:PIN domain-containing protein [Nocardioides sp. GY 10113]TIC89101.1 PIN domain-containing protein [Nocardioides sp. GY 10113]